MTRRPLLAVVVVAVLAASAAAAVGGAAGSGAAAGDGGDAAASHPTPPPGTPSPTAQPRTPGDDGMSMRMQMADGGMVVNPNANRTPPGCDRIRGEKTVTLEAGSEFADDGEAFGFSTDSIQVEPCTRLTVTFRNRDDVRHQFMVHGLPKAIHPMGMFTIEADGGATVTGSFVAPAKPYVLHTHCSLPQHQQKGMLMEVVVGDGSAGLVGGSGGHGGHTHTAGGHSPSEAMPGAPGFGSLGALLAAALATLWYRSRPR